MNEDLSMVDEIDLLDFPLFARLCMMPCLSELGEE